MDEYDRKLGEESTVIVDRGAAGHGGSQSRQLVGRTWQLSLDALAGQGLPEATALLRLLSFLAADPVPLSVLVPVARGEVTVDGLEPALRPEQLEPALKGLIDHSLADLVTVDGARCVRAHGVLLDSVAEGVPEDRRAIVADAAASLLEAALPGEGSDSPATASIPARRDNSSDALTQKPTRPCSRTASLNSQYASAVLPQPPMPCTTCTSPPGPATAAPSVSRSCSRSRRMPGARPTSGIRTESGAVGPAPAESAVSRPNSGPPAPAP